jgi:hypothetical protein
LRVAVDARGNLYVTEPAKGRVMKYDSAGTFLTSVNVPYPLGVAVDANGKIYVGSAPASTRLVSNTVRMYSSSLQDLGCLGGTGTCALFGAPNDIAIDNFGRIYVVDSEFLVSAVKVFEPYGSLALTITGAAGNLLRKPMGIAINDATGEVFVTDSPKDMCQGNEVDAMRVAVFDKSGNFLRQYGKDGSDISCGTTLNGLAVDGANTLYIADSKTNAVRHLNGADGSSIGGDLFRDFSFQPTDVAISGSNVASVAVQKRIDRYGLDGYVIMSATPASLAFDATQFGGNPPAQTVVIANTGSGTLNWSASADRTWITLGAQNVVGPNSSVGFDIGADISTLTAGSYTGTVTITSAGGLQAVIAATLNVASASFTITSSAGAGGAINPAGALSVNYGSSATFTITPNSGYGISNVLVDGANQGAISTYTFTNVTSNHTISASFALTGADTVPPTGTVTINGGAGYTRTASSTLTLTCTDNVKCTQMQFSNDFGTTWSTAATYTTTKAWTLTSGAGVKTVYARFKDAASNLSAVVSDTITLETTAPTTSASPAGGSYTTAQNVVLICTDALSGCDKTYYTLDGTTPTASSAVYTGPILINNVTILKYFSRDLAGNQETVKTQTYTIDLTGPAGTVTINGGADYGRTASSTLTLTCSDNVKCTQMQFSNDLGATWSTTATYTTTKAWTLTSGAGVKTVSARFKDAAGNLSAVVSDTITIETTPPVTTASPIGGTYGASQTVTLTCTDAASGCDKTYYTLDGTTPTIASAVYTGPIILTANTTLKYFSRDRATNQETVKTQTYTLDTLAPTGTVIINAGAAYTKTTSASLRLTCSDNNICSQMQFSNDFGATWSTAATYTLTKTWTMTTGDGEKTVYARFKDAAGNWSAPVSDTIIYDKTVPTNGTVTATANAGSIDLTWTGFSDALSGIASYKLVYSTTASPSSSCSTGTVLYTGTATTFNHPGALTGTTYYYRVCATDNAGNVSTGAIKSIVAP